MGQSGIVVVYVTYLLTSAVANRDDKNCNPLTTRSESAQTSMIVLGALFTFLAIAYSTSRAATQSKALRGSSSSSSSKSSSGRREGPIRLPADSHSDEELSTVVNGGNEPIRIQPTAKKESLRYQALQAAVDAGTLPASALENFNDPDADSDNDENEDEGAPGAKDRDDERSGTAYNYTYFHIM